LELRGPLPRNIHICGICGKATAPLAVELARLGFKVTGSDSSFQEPASLFLQGSSIPCKQGFSADVICEKIDLVLAGALSGAENPEVRRARELGIRVTNYARFVGEQFLSDARCAVVTGSFGKTTTTAMLASILHEAALDPSWLVGGESSSLPGAARLRQGGFWALEGDEYPSGIDDTSPKFSYYRPEVGVLTSLAHVHPNKIPSLEATVKLFSEFVHAVRRAPVFAADTPAIRNKLKPACPPGSVRTVGFGKSANTRLRCLQRHQNETRFRLEGVQFSLCLRGNFACTNAALAALAAQTWGVALEESAEIISRFKGVYGRQEIIADSSALTVVYDMGIYPQSIAQVVRAFASSGSSRRLCVLFHPRHTLGRPEAYYRDLARALAPADLVLLADATNPPITSGVFELDPQRLRSLLPETTKAVAVGNALSCFPHWKENMKVGDTWLIFTEPLFPEPIGSIRRHALKVTEKESGATPL
jgi:UDP-N-acetylmuramate: L-alanyl-gamma-D-glutamyl-meso-diaminopimelate ligase